MQNLDKCWVFGFTKRAPKVMLSVFFLLFNVNPSVILVH